jgi:hypothetical protein
MMKLYIFRPINSVISDYPLHSRCSTSQTLTLKARRNTYPYMVTSEFLRLASTYRPPELGQDENYILYLVAKGIQSAHDINKEFKKGKVREKQWIKKYENAQARVEDKSPSYKDVHKIIKRLAQLRLIYEVEKHSEEAKHYRVTPYGLITSLAKDSKPEIRSILYNNKDNIVIRSLLDFFEEETINHFHSLEGFLALIIEQYLQDCCSLTVDICRKFWTRFQKYNITDILPTDDVIQKCVSSLEGIPVEEYVLNGIHEYQQKLAERLVNGDKILINAVNDYNDYETLEYYSHFVPYLPSCPPPFPMVEIYMDIVVNLEHYLEEKAKLFAFSLITELGQRVPSHSEYQGLSGKEKLMVGLERDMTIDYIRKDKQFIEFVRPIKQVFDAGCKQFS